MGNKFEVEMAKRSDAELIRILGEHRNEYQPEAVEAAELELEKRDLSPELLHEAVIANEAKKIIFKERANENLGAGFKVLTFIFPGLIQIFFSSALKAEGYDRKAKELTNWTLYGFAMYFGLVILIMILKQVL